MKKILIVAFIHLITLVAYSQQVRIVNFEELETTFKKPSDTLQVVNFWATWCGPCVEEMKYFIQAQDSFETNKVVFTYVSLDFSKQKERVEQFIKKNGLKGNFYILKDDPNNYINKVDKNWEGQIPFTLIITEDNKYISHNAAFATFDELNEFIKNNLSIKK